MDRKERFRKLCLENGLDPDDLEYGSKTLLAWMWFNLGADEAEEYRLIAEELGPLPNWDE